MRIQEIEIPPLGHLEDHPYSELLKLKSLAVILRESMEDPGPFSAESLQHGN
jgi:hypothetical protein